MLKEIKGRVVLSEAPDWETAKRILGLIRMLHQDVPVKELARKLMHPPFVLVKKTKISSALHIVDHFKEIGAQAEFVPFTADESKPFEDSFDIEVHDDPEEQPRKRSLIKKAMSFVVRSSD